MTTELVAQSPTVEEAKRPSLATSSSAEPAAPSLAATLERGRAVAADPVAGAGSEPEPAAPRRPRHDSLPLALARVRALL